MPRPIPRAAGGVVVGGAAKPAVAPPVSSRYQPYAPKAAAMTPNDQQNIVIKKVERPVIVMQTTWDLPFNQLERRCVEHHARNLNRPLCPGFLSSQALWLKNAADTAASMPPFTPKMSTTTLEKPAEKTEGHINVRAFLVTGVRKDESQHVLHRIKCVFSQTDGAVQAYGGSTSVEDAPRQKQFLTEAVEAQCGVHVADWLPLTELQYGDSKTMFYIPVGLEGNVCFSKGTDTQPTTSSLIELIDYKITCASSNKNLWELLTAADAYDEYLLRDMVVRIRKLLLESTKKMKAAQEAEQDHKGRVVREKARREQEARDRRKACEDKEKSLKETWRREDEGKTDRQKKDLGEKRSYEMKQIRDECESITISDTKVKEPLHEVILKEDNTALVCFQYFDRPKGIACGTGTV
eukprot:TRINITY_DN13566_c0_g1_i1.p1 TRINITY_DN13566_c0_g1~~TRINITY_DN13566_c0_g1_i1.p1  ORF type:complete len:424 (+),score=97.68 TRINITY_DN13566_c0_g1_i1:51-1274(+)